ncbi:mCG1049958 [Mus musculus]|nr:mCG1049958 [Mus musculus]
MWRKPRGPGKMCMLSRRWEPIPNHPGSLRTSVISNMFSRANERNSQDSLFNLTQFVSKFAGAFP